MRDKFFYSMIVENLEDGIYFVDKNKSIRVWNAAAEKITGFSSKSVKGRLCSDNLLDPIGGGGGLLCLNGCPLEMTLEDGSPHEIEVFIRHQQGHRIPVTIKTLPAYEDGEIVGAVVVMSPADTEQNDGGPDDPIAKLRLLDRPTGLPNRRRLEVIMDSKCREYKRAGLGFSVVIINIMFENDETTDDVIMCTAESLKESVRAGDIAGRWGTNEFLVIFYVDSDEKRRMVENKMRSAVAKGTKHLKQNRFAVHIGSTMVCGADTAISIVERAKYLSLASAENASRSKRKHNK